MTYDVYLRDFFGPRSIPLPSLTCKIEDLPLYFNNPISLEFKSIDEDTYIRYPELFGVSSVLSKVWFKQSILGEVNNHFLYCLELFILDNKSLDLTADTSFYVKDVRFPITINKQLIVL